jgi:hypothetical protein
MIPLPVMWGLHERHAEVALLRRLDVAIRQITVLDVTSSSAAVRRGRFSGRLTILFGPVVVAFALRGVSLVLLAGNRLRSTVNTFPIWGNTVTTSITLRAPSRHGKPSRARRDFDALVERRRHAAQVLNQGLKAAPQVGIHCQSVSR